MDVLCFSWDGLLWAAKLIRILAELKRGSSSWACSGRANSEQRTANIE
jgi:hypothetical protein